MKGSINSEAKSLKENFDEKELSEILGIRDEGYNDYKKLKLPSLENLPTSLAITRKFVDRDLEQEPRAVCKNEMKPAHKMLFEFVNKVVLPR